MPWTLTSEQRAFRDAIRTMVDREVRPIAHEYERSGRYPDEVVQTMAKLGLFGMLAPEQHGGLGTDLVSFAIAFEEISRGWMGVAGIIGSHNLSTWMIANHGTDEQRDRYLPGLASGERRTGIALTEPGAGTDLQGITTRAVRRGDAYVVTGTKTWITNARHANPLPVLVKTDPEADPSHRGMSMLLVDATASGFAVSRDLGKLGYHGPETCEVSLQDVEVPATDLLGGTEGRGMQQALSALAYGRINVAARAVGVGQAALDAALPYAEDRHAFGQPIADFQAVQLRLAEMATGVQASRLMTYWAADRLERLGSADAETAMAKVFASEQTLTLVLDAMRIFGAYGYSTEFDVERLYRDAPLMAIGEGTNDILRTVITRRLRHGLDLDL